MTTAPADLALQSLQGKSYKLRDWLTSYPFLLVAIDPYKAESSWVLDTSKRIFSHFSPADIRVGWVCLASSEGCREFLGPLAEEYLTFPDPTLQIAQGLHLTEYPSLIHIRSDGFLQTASGWDPATWKPIINRAAEILAWSSPTIPGKQDPDPYPGMPPQSSVSP